MGILNRISLFQFPNPLEAYTPIQKVENYWLNPQVKLDRIIFPDLTQARLFLTDLPYTSWAQENKITYPAECQGRCNTEEIDEMNPELKSNLSSDQEILDEPLKTISPDP